MFLVNNYKTIKKNKMKAIFKSISKTLIAATMIIGFASNAKAQDDKTKHNIVSTKKRERRCSQKYAIHLLFEYIQNVL